MDLFPAILFFSLCAAGSAAGGLAAMALWPAAVRRVSDLLEAAAGGALLVIGAVFLAPEALRLADHGLLLIAAGFLAGLVLRGGAARTAGTRAADLTLLTGLCLHSFVDGVAFAVALSANPAFGLGSAFGLILHEAPEALLAFILLRNAGVGAKTAGAGAVVAAGGLTAAGALSAAPLIGDLRMESLGAFMGLASGLLIFAGLACLRASLARSPRRARAGAALASAVLVAGVGQLGHRLEPHGGADHDHAAEQPHS